MRPNHKFPSVCVDGFYDDPDEVLAWAKSCRYLPDPNGQWPGMRSDDLSKLDKDFVSRFSEKFFKIFFEQESPSFVLTTYFQVIKPFHEDKDHPMNWGWIHTDSDPQEEQPGSPEYAGLVYLSPDADLNTGTSIFKLKGKQAEPLTDQPCKEDLFTFKGVDETVYADNMRHIRSQYEETVRYNNVYNRLIAFESKHYHAANNYHNDDYRFTQVFFVRSIESKTYPLQR